MERGNALYGNICMCPAWLTRHGVAGLVLEDVGEVLDVELRGVAVELDPGRVLAREDADAERKLLVLIKKKK